MMIRNDSYPIFELSYLAAVVIGILNKLRDSFYHLKKNKENYRGDLLIYCEERIIPKPLIYHKNHLLID